MVTDLNIIKTADRKFKHQDISGNDSVKHEITGSLKQIQLIADQWYRIEDSYQNPLISYDWFYSCMAALYPEDKLYANILTSTDRVQAICPLFYNSQFRIKKLEIPGTDILMEPTTLLAENDSVFARMMETILNLKEPVFLRRLILTQSQKKIVDRLVKKKSFLLVMNTTGSYFIPIECSWEKFEKDMKSSQRSRLRRFRKRLEQAGSFEIEVHSEDSEQFRNAINVSLLVESSGWKAIHGTSVLTNKKLNSFFSTYIDSAMQAGILRLFLLKVDGRAIAMILGVEYANCFWTLKIGYNESWSRFAPGIILHHESIKWAFQKKLNKYEFLGTLEPWITTWTKQKNTYYTYRLFPKNIKGIICLVVEGITFLNNRFFSTMKQILRILNLKKGRS